MNNTGFDKTVKRRCSNGVLVDVMSSKITIWNISHPDSIDIMYYVI